MKGLKWTIFGALFGLAVVGGSTETGAAAEPGVFPEVPTITKEELKPILGDPDMIILDVRFDDQWKASDQKLPGAIHEDPEDVESWAHKYPKDKTLIFY